MQKPPWWRHMVAKVQKLVCAPLTPLYVSSKFLALAAFRGESLVSSSQPAYFLCAKANSPSFFAELTEFAVELSEFSLPKQCSRNSIPLRFLVDFRSWGKIFWLGLATKAITFLGLRCLGGRDSNQDPLANRIA